MKKTISKVLCIGLLVCNVVLNTTILKEIKSTKITETQEVPDLNKLSYFNNHRLMIKNMTEIKKLEDKEYLVLFYSDDCRMCDLTKEDIAAFIYYGWANKINIYFVNIDESENIIGEPNGDELENQLIYATPTMFAVNGDEYQKYEGVDEIYNLLNMYVKE